MKIQRYKRVRRCLNFYKNNFAIDKPYKIIADGTFCKAALDNKINLREQMMIYFGGEIQFFTTACVIRELELLGQNLYGAFLIAKSYETAYCKHKSSSPSTAADCLLKIAGKKNNKKYFFATQDRSLTESLRNVVGCPILYINYNTVVLENPSETSTKAAAASGEEKINFDGVQRENLFKLKESLPVDVTTKEHQQKKRRKLKGPNPLSVKKKKQPTKITTTIEETRSRKRKSRHRRGNSSKKVKPDG